MRPSRRVTLQHRITMKAGEEGTAAHPAGSPRELLEPDTIPNTRRWPSSGAESKFLPNMTGDLKDEEELFFCIPRGALYHRACMVLWEQFSFRPETITVAAQVLELAT